MATLLQQPQIATGSRFWSLAMYLGICSLVWLLGLVVYRLYFSPIAHVPGPRLAATTFWYECYYDLIRDGSYTWKIKSLHEKYGPIIRINPYEVHVNDPEFYDEVYVGAATRKTDKWGWAVNVFPTPGSVVMTVPHDLHRHRRAMVSSHFSTAAIQRLEPLIRDKVDKLIHRFKDASRLGNVVPMRHAYSALVVDVITSYAFAESWGFLDAPDLSPDLIEKAYKFSPLSNWNKHFPEILSLLLKAPKVIGTLMGRPQTEKIDMKQDFVHKVEEIRDRRSKSAVDMPKGEAAGAVVERADSIFETMLDADVPEPEKTTERLAMEANTLVFAGILTTQHTLETITYHLTANSSLRTRLIGEIASAKLKARDNDRTADTIGLTLRTLESLPYLTAIIREGLRLSYGITQRLPRVSPDTVLRYKDYQLPPGTPVSMSALMMHENEDIFPDALEFKPERWLPLETVGQKLNRYLVPFSKGSRQCVGMNLAMTELYLTTAAVFGSRLELELYDVDFDRDIKVMRDAFNPLPSRESKGLRMTVSSKEGKNSTT